MAIQILGLRDYINKKTGKPYKRHVFFEKGWRVSSVEKIFTEPDKNIALIPEADRVNLYFTVADCHEEEARKLKEQWVIPFDIDNLGIESDLPEDIKKACLPVLELCCEEMKLDINKVAAVFSGNGLQFFVKLSHPIMSEEFFDTMREQYKVLCDKIQARLTLNHLKGKVDTSVFSTARLMRLPNTWNQKPHGKKWAFVLQSHLESQPFNLEELTGDAEIKRADTVAKEVWKRFPKPDQKNILSGCEFLKHCKAEPNKVSEHQWYAMVGVTAFLPDGEKLTHDYSSGYKGYDPQETQEKFEQAQRASGPRTCKDIGARWDGCKGCQYYNTVTSPIAIKGDDYIGTADTGFRKVSFDDQGKPRPGKVEFEDLVKQFLSEHEYAKIDKNGMYVYHPENKKWEEISSNRMKAYCRDKVHPKPSGSEMNEFLERMQQQNIKPKSWLDGSDNRHTNFNNGVLDRSTMELKPHSPDFGFKYVLPFNYDPYAKAPRFEQFLDEVTDGDSELAQLLKEFGGYCLSGDDYWEHKSLILIGDGENGKSVFMETLGILAGKNNYSTATMQDLANQVNRYAIVNKLFNYSEETSVRAFGDSSVFKTLSAGGSVTVKQLYEQPFEYHNKAKLIISCNEMPKNSDATHGMFRRMLIVPFNRIFSKQERDPHLKEKLALEASGIYNVLLSAYYDAKKNKGLFVPKVSEELLDEYKLDSDVERRFFNTHIKYDSTKEVRVTDLYTSYVSFCELNGFKNQVKNSAAFAKKLKKFDPDWEKRKHRKEDNGKFIRVIKGISLEQEL
jgi:putative DNA primase/helicase